MPVVEVVAVTVGAAEVIVLLLVTTDTVELEGGLGAPGEEATLLDDGWNLRTPTEVAGGADELALCVELTLEGCVVGAIPTGLGASPLAMLRSSSSVNAGKRSSRPWNL